MGELLPILTGLIVGGILGLIKPSIRLAIGIVLAVPLGVLATFLTGEHHISWAFVLIDIPIVGFSAIAGLALARWLGARGRARSAMPEV
jgi:hypothetical protein